MLLTTRTPGSLAQIACLLEVTARKPGNVHRFRDFAESHYLDFGLSALAIGPALDLARTEGIGPAVLHAVRATRSVVSTNTNLGMILLFAPLAAVFDEEPLRVGLRRVLESTTVDDALRVYEAIRLARPAGLGTVSEHDLASEPTIRLLEAMRLGSAHDSVARQYVNGFADVLYLALPSLASSLGAGQSLETAIVGTHLNLLAQVPDTLIARKRGVSEAFEASRLAAEVIARGWPETAEGRQRADDLDRWLRAEGNGRNPGTTADLVAAALFAGLREGIISLPIDKSFWTGSTEITQLGQADPAVVQGRPDQSGRDAEVRQGLQIVESPDSAADDDLGRRSLTDDLTGQRPGADALPRADP